MIRLHFDMAEAGKLFLINELGATIRARRSKAGRLSLDVEFRILSSAGV